MTPPANRSARAGTVQRIWILLPFVFLLWRGLNTPFLLLDFWWHLKLGEIIVTTRSIPSTDLFSFTAAGQSFIAQNWLFEVLIYLLYRIGGLEGLVLFSTLLLLATLFFVHRTVSRRVADVRVVAIADLLTVVGLMLCSNLRTQLVSFLFFAVLYRALEHFRDGHWKKLFVVPPVMMLWVNIHGAFVLGLALFALYVVWVGFANRFRQHPRSSVGAWGVLLLSALATLANPYGWRVYEYVAEVSNDPSIRTYVREWQPPRIEEPEMIVAVFAPGALVILSMIVSRRRPEAIEVLLTFGFLAFALLSRRNAIWFSIIAAPIFARQLAGIDWGRAAGSLTESQPSRGVQRILNGSIVASLILVSLVALPWVYPRLGNERIGTSIVERRTPVGAVDFIEERRLSGRLFHPQLYGDYIIWRLWPEQKTFIDGRVHLFPLSISHDYVQAMNAIGWQELMQRWKIEHILLSKDEPEASALIAEVRKTPEWNLVYEDRRSVLFSRVPVRSMAQSASETDERTNTTATSSP